MTCTRKTIPILSTLLFLMCSNAQAQEHAQETNAASEDDAAAISGDIDGGAEAETPATTTSKSLEETSPFRLELPEIYGYVQAHYRYAFETGSDGLVDNSDFRVQRVRIGLRGKVLPWAGYEVDFDPRAPEVRGILRDAFVSLWFIPRHELRIGQQKMQFGYENRVSSSRLYAVNRTEVSDNLSRGVNLRDQGIGLLGNIKLGRGFRIEDAITVGNGAHMNAQDDNTPVKNVWGRLGFRYKNSPAALVTRLGVSGSTGDMVDEGNDPIDPADDERIKFKRLGVDLEVDQQWFFVSAELVMGWDRNRTLKESDEPMGYYVNLVGKTPWEIGPIVRLDTLGEDYRRWTFGAYYGLPDSIFRVLLNYELREISEDSNGHIGRGDDKLYLWTQVKF